MAEPKHNHLVLDFNTGDVVGLALPRAPSPVGTIVTFSAICLATDSVGDAASISGPESGGLYQVTKTDIDSSDMKLAISVGVIISKSTSTQCVVQALGELQNIYLTFTPGARMFINTSGSLSQGPPVSPLTGTRIVQQMAHVLSGDTIYIQPMLPIKFIA